MKEMLKMKPGTVSDIDFEITPVAPMTFDHLGYSTGGATHDRRTVIRLPGGWFIVEQFGGASGVFVPISNIDRVRIAVLRFKELTSKFKDKWDAHRLKPRSK